MSLTLHIVRKDLIRLRGWIACWVAVLLLPIVIGVQLLAHNPLAAEEWRMPAMVAISMGLEVLVGYVLVILLIHEDGIVGTRQFWLTRPISRSRLLFAKTIGGFILVGLLPVVVSLPWWWWCGFEPRQMGAASAEILAVAALVIVVAAAVAVLTDSLARAILWTLAVVAVALFSVLFFGLAIHARVQSERDVALFVSCAVVAVIVIGIEVAMLVAIQFLLRRRGWWLGAIGGLMVTSIFGAMHWPWPWVPAEPREHHVERAAGVALRFSHAVAEPRRARGSYRVGEEIFQQVDLVCVGNGAPPDLGLASYGARLRWQWDNGTKVERSTNVNGGSGPTATLGLRWSRSDSETNQWFAEKFNRHADRPLAKDEFTAEMSAWLQPSAVARIETEPPKFEARVWWQLLRPELCFEVPLAPGSWKAVAGRGLRIDQVERTSGNVVIAMVETNPMLISGMLNEFALSHSVFQRIDLERARLLLALDRQRGEIIDSFGDRCQKERIALVNGVRIEWSVRPVVNPTVLRDGKWMPRPGEVDFKSIGVMTMREEAVFARDVKVNRLELAK